MVMNEDNNDENNNIWRLPMPVSADGLIPAGYSAAAPDYGFIQSSRY